MNPRLRRLLGSTAGLLPVTVRAGVAKGARWTLFPWTSYWRGTHEPVIQDAIASLGGGDIRGWPCWDLGAHFGLYSVALALRVGRQGEVAAFEPNPESFARLERHRLMNRLTWLKTYEAAASDRTGSSQLLTYGEMDSTSTHLRYDKEDVNEASKPIGIRTLRLDDEVEAGRLRAPRFIKVDVEGHGHRALEGMRGSIAKSRPTMIIAFHSTEEVAGVLGVLQPLGYRWTAIVAPPSEPDSLIGGDYLFAPA
jgi:FkbM family methyltransferase